MLYPSETIEQKLGFDKIRLLLKQACISVLGQEYVDKIRFSIDFDVIKKLTSQTAEFLSILNEGEAFPAQNYLNVFQHLEKAKLEGTFLSEEEFFDLKLSMTTIQQCLAFFEKKTEEQYPLLKELTSSIEFETALIKKIDSIIDDRGKIRNTASPLLNQLQKSIIDAQSRLRRQLDIILKEAKTKGFAKEDANFTIREGRMVIPIQAEFKRQIKGFVHDESATGQTVFLEPTQILDTNNEVKELEYKVRREIIRILTDLTDNIRPHIHKLRKAYNYLGMIDFIRAKARFAQDINAINPEFEKKTILKWRNAKHPLLHLNFKAQGKSIVPQSLELNPEQRIIIISGPNAGGKSVTLKTVGLLQYMYQSGLLISVAEGSKVGLFRDIFIDIGDEQSLENDLSTYSSHLKNMQAFLKYADKKTLFLIDEFGTGTEPIVGAAIAEAILEQLNLLKSYGIITTHYSNLKVFAENTQGLTNAAMRFDAENLEPLYQLEIGKPGSSFAFEIAQKIGLPNAIIENSKSKVGVKQVKLDKLIRELEVEKQHYLEANSTFVNKQALLDQSLADYTKLKEYVDKEKKKLINQAKVEAQKLILKANQQIEQTIKQIKESQADKNTTKEARKALETFKEENKVEEQIPVEVFVEEKVADVPQVVVIEGAIEVGDYVRIIGQETVGEVISLGKKDAEIVFGDLKSNIKMDRLEKINRKIYRQQQKKIKTSFKGLNMNERMAQFNPRLDVRGNRGEEVLVQINDLMDDAILLGQSELYIVHGKGDGILRNLIRQHLTGFKEVTSLQSEHADHGGDGVTIVHLK